MEQVQETMRQILERSRNIVVLSGLNVMRETGLNGVRAEHVAYETEEQYGYANDEIISSAFYARRGEVFYDYVKNVILNIDDPQPTVVHKAVRQLQQKGKVSHIITRTVYELYEKAGCEDVVDMHGSIEQNKCPACDKIFGMKYVKQSKGEPRCDVCQVPIRPGFTLLGERVDNGKMSAACEYVEEADVLLVLGAAVRDPLCQHLERYYTGKQFILINTEKKLGDERADYAVYGSLSEIVPYITQYDPDYVVDETPEKVAAPAATQKKTND